MWAWLCKHLGIPYRFRKAFFLAILASLFAVILATVPVVVIWNDYEYSPQIAVTTATLITIVWYTFFAYWAANREEDGFAVLDLKRDRQRLIPQVRNPTHRTLRVRVVMRVWVDEGDVTMGSFYRGEDEFIVPPQETFSGSLSLWDEITIGRDDIGEPIIEQKTIRVSFHATWIDDLAEPGMVGPKYFTAPFDADTEVASVVSDENIRRWFPEVATA